MPEPLSPPVPLAGTVADHPLDDVVRTLCQQRRDAVVRVQHGADWGTIEIAGGRVAAVEYRGLDGDEALMRITALASGSFSVDLRDPAPAPFGNDLDRVRDDAQQRRARIEELVQAVGGPTQVYRIDVRELGSVLEQIPDEVNAVMRLCDGRRTISEVLAAASFEEVTTLRVLQRLQQLHVLRPADGEEALPPRAAAGKPLPTGVFAIGSAAALVDDAAGAPAAAPTTAPIEAPTTAPIEAPTTAPIEAAAPPVATAPPESAAEAPVARRDVVAPWVQHHLEPRAEPAPLVALWKDVDPSSPVVARWTSQPRSSRNLDDTQPEFVPGSISEALGAKPGNGGSGDQGLSGWLDASEVNFFSLLGTEPAPFELPPRTQPRELFPYVLTLAFVLLVVAALGIYVLVFAGPGSQQAAADYYGTIGNRSSDKPLPVISVEPEQARVMSPFEAAWERAKDNEVEIGMPVVTPVRTPESQRAAGDKKPTAGSLDETALKPIAEPVPGDAGKSFAQLYAEGTLLLKREKYAQALPKFEAAMLRDPGDARVYLAIGQIYFEYGEIKRALSYYRKAEALAPRTPKVHLLMGLALHESGDYQEARLHYETYLSLSPDVNEASAVRGILETLPQ